MDKALRVMCIIMVVLGIAVCITGVKAFGTFASQMFLSGMLTCWGICRLIDDYAERNQ